jgi:hypothetical protein
MLLTSQTASRADSQEVNTSPPPPPPCLAPLFLSRSLSLSISAVLLALDKPVMLQEVEDALPPPPPLFSPFASSLPLSVRDRRAMVHAADDSLRAFLIASRPCRQQDVRGQDSQGTAHPPSISVFRPLPLPPSLSLPHPALCPKRMGSGAGGTARLSHVHCR